MKINDDRLQTVLVHTANSEWLDSPQAGVKRIPLERLLPESGPVTSVVKYEAGSSFSAHLHPGGEEILVLDGVFEDGDGRYPVGSYIRNPPGSSHKPFSRAGCVLLVKLNWFNAKDTRTLHIANLFDDEANIGKVMILHQFGDETTSLITIPKGLHVSIPHVQNGNELFVIKGQVSSEREDFAAGDWFREVASTAIEFKAAEDTVIYRKTGHIMPTGANADAIT